MGHTPGEPAAFGRRRSYEIEPSDGVGEAVVTAVADATDRSPSGMEPLFETVDPDALEAVFDPPGPDSNLRLAFGYEGCEVVVGSDRVRVRPPARE